MMLASSYYRLDAVPRPAVDIKYQTNIGWENSVFLAIAAVAPDPLDDDPCALKGSSRK
jgi:hypothetical protein